MPNWSDVALSRDEFIGKIQEEGSSLYRDLPWRNIDDAYGVLVSEVMLQQTQVSRVMRYWQRWMDLFPTIDALAAADTALVLEMWQGLGYNRRALALKRACETCSAEYSGRLPLTAEELVKLPGIGPATAGGIVAFAYNQPALYLETNVRSVFLHELFPKCVSVSDKELVPYIVDTCPAKPLADQDEEQAWGPRSWYYALLDYGAHLKASGANPSRRSAHHTRQSKFEGSHREKRSFIQQVLKIRAGKADRALSNDAEVDIGLNPKASSTIMTPCWFLEEMLMGANCRGGRQWAS